MGEGMSRDFIIRCCEEWSKAQTTEECALLPIFSTASRKLTEEDITQLTRIAMYLNSDASLRTLVARRGWYEVACIHCKQSPDELENAWDARQNAMCLRREKLRPVPDNKEINVAIAGQYKR